MQTTGNWASSIIFFLSALPLHTNWIADKQTIKSDIYFCLLQMSCCIRYRFYLLLFFFRFCSMVHRVFCIQPYFTRFFVLHSRRGLTSVIGALLLLLLLLALCPRFYAIFGYTNFIIGIVLLLCVWYSIVQSRCAVECIHFYYAHNSTRQISTDYRWTMTVLLLLLHTAQ